MNKMSKKEKRIQKALGTYPMQECALCKRTILKSDIQYEVVGQCGALGLCRLCVRTNR